MDEDILAHMRDAQTRARVLEEFNQSSLDSGGPIGGKQGRRVLQEINELQVTSACCAFTPRRESARLD